MPKIETAEEAAAILREVSWRGWLRWKQAATGYVMASDNPRPLDVLAPIDAIAIAQGIVDARELARCGRILARIIDDLPTSRDWLDPAVEREAVELANAYEEKE